MRLAAVGAGRHPGPEPPRRPRRGRRRRAARVSAGSRRRRMGCQPADVDEDVEGRAPQRPRDVRRGPYAVGQREYRALARGDGRAGDVGRAAAVRGPHHGGAVEVGVRPQPVEQFTAARRLPLHRVGGYGVHRADPVGHPVTEPGGAAARRQGEVRRVVQRAQVADLQLAPGHLPALDEEPADRSLGPGPVDGLLPPLGAEPSGGGQQDVDTGGGRARRAPPGRRPGRGCRGHAAGRRWRVRPRGGRASGRRCSAAPGPSQHQSFGEVPQP